MTYAGAKLTNVLSRASSVARGSLWPGGFWTAAARGWWRDSVRGEPASVSRLSQVGLWEVIELDALAGGFESLSSLEEIISSTPRVRSTVERVCE
jgi:hypothetical protein